jgi:hypothetical protein
MKRKIYYLYLFLLFSFIVNAQQADTQQPLRTNISVHDPVMFQQDSLYYIFCTGNGIANWSSKDMINWKMEKPVFATVPQWAKNSIKGFRDNSLWYGVGHNSAYTFNGTHFLIFHGYDAKDNARPKLRIEKMTWDKEKWPVINADYHLSLGS